jgi:hypothetical protein
LLLDVVSSETVDTGLDENEAAVPSNRATDRPSEARERGRGDERRRGGCGVGEATEGERRKEKKSKDGSGEERGTRKE